MDTGEWHKTQKAELTRQLQTLFPNKTIQFLQEVISTLDPQRFTPPGQLGQASTYGQWLQSCAEYILRSDELQADHCKVASSGGQVIAPETSAASGDTDTDSMVHQVLAMFPDVNADCVRSTIAKTQFRFKDNILDRTCNYMFENPHLCQNKITSTVSSGATPRLPMSVNQPSTSLGDSDLKNATPNPVSPNRLRIDAELLELGYSSDEDLPSYVPPRKSAKLTSSDHLRTVADPASRTETALNPIVTVISEGTDRETGLVRKLSAMFDNFSNTAMRRQQQPSSTTGASAVRLGMKRDARDSNASPSVHDSAFIGANPVSSNAVTCSGINMRTALNRSSRPQPASTLTGTHTHNTTHTANTRTSTSLYTPNSSSSIHTRTSIGRPLATISTQGNLNINRYASSTSSHAPKTGPNTATPNASTLTSRTTVIRKPVPFVTSTQCTPLNRKATLTTSSNIPNTSRHTPNPNSSLHASTFTRNPAPAPFVSSTQSTPSSRKATSSNTPDTSQHTPNPRPPVYTSTCSMGIRKPTQCATTSAFCTSSTRNATPTSNSLKVSATTPTVPIRAPCSNAATTSTASPSLQAASSMNSPNTNKMTAALKNKLAIALGRLSPRKRVNLVKKLQTIRSRSPACRSFDTQVLLEAARRQSAAESSQTGHSSMNPSTVPSVPSTSTRKICLSETSFPHTLSSKGTVSGASLAKRKKSSGSFKTSGAASTALGQGQMRQQSHNRSFSVPTPLSSASNAAPLLPLSTQTPVSYGNIAFTTQASEGALSKSVMPERSRQPIPSLCSLYNQRFKGKRRLRSRLSLPNIKPVNPVLDTTLLNPKIEPYSLGNPILESQAVQTPQIESSDTHRLDHQALLTPKIEPGSSVTPRSEHQDKSISSLSSLYSNAQSKDKRPLSLQTSQNSSVSVPQHSSPSTSTTTIVDRTNQDVAFQRLKAAVSHIIQDLGTLTSHGMSIPNKNFESGLRSVMKVERPSEESASPASQASNDNFSTCATAASSFGTADVRKSSDSLLSRLDNPPSPSSHRRNSVPCIHSTTGQRNTDFVSYPKLRPVQSLKRSPMQTRSLASHKTLGSKGAAVQLFSPSITPPAQANKTPSRWQSVSADDVKLEKLPTSGGNSMPAFNSAQEGTGRVTGTPMFSSAKDGTGRVTGTPTFSSAKDGTGRVTGTPTFSSAEDGTGRVTGTPTFSSAEDGTGRVTGTPTFSSAEDGTGRITGTPTFSSAQDGTGRVTGTPTFSSAQERTSRITGTLTFNSPQEGTSPLSQTSKGSTMAASTHESTRSIFSLGHINLEKSATSEGCSMAVSNMTQEGTNRVTGTLLFNCGQEGTSGATPVSTDYEKVEKVSISDENCMAVSYSAQGDTSKATTISVSPDLINPGPSSTERVTAMSPDVVPGPSGTSRLNPVSPDIICRGPSQANVNEVSQSLFPDVIKKSNTIYSDVLSTGTSSTVIPPLPPKVTRPGPSGLSQMSPVVISPGPLVTSKLTSVTPDSSQDDDCIIIASPSRSTPDSTSKQVIVIKEDATSSDPLPAWLACEACQVSVGMEQVYQCCDGHVICTKCVEKQAKNLLSGQSPIHQSGLVSCPCAGCSSNIPRQDLHKALPSIIMDLLDDKLQKEAMKALEEKDELVRCPHCEFAALLDHSEKQFSCKNTDCKAVSCRHCKKVWVWAGLDHDKCGETVPMETESIERMEVVPPGEAELLPPHWSSQNASGRDKFVQEIVQPSSEEWATVRSLMCKTLKNFQIKSIHRVQNIRLWKKFSAQRENMLEDNGSDSLNEKWLFHGTAPAVVENICREGFDWRMCGANATSYGQGAYFARDARYSHRYSSGQVRSMQGLSFSTLMQAGALPRGLAQATVQSRKALQKVILQQQQLLLTRLNAAHGAGQAGAAPFGIVMAGTSAGNLAGTSAGTSYPPAGPAHNNPVTNSNTAGTTMVYGHTTGSSHGHHSGTVLGHPAGSTLGHTARIIAGHIAGAPLGQAAVGARRLRRNVGLLHMHPLGSSAHLRTNASGQQPIASSSNPALQAMHQWPPRSHHQGMANPLTSAQSPPVRGLSCSSAAAQPQPPPMQQQQIAATGPPYYLFLAKVLVGRYTEGHARLRKPPVDTKFTDGRTFDSCVDSEIDPQIYVIFDSSQAYPEYIISYTDV